MIEEELLQKAKNGDSDALNTIILGYKNTVAGICRKYFLLGGDQEDLIQEGMRGLFSAINTYESNRGTTFNTYACRLIEREVISAVRKEHTLGKLAMHDAVTLDESVGDDTTPEQEFLDAENVKGLIVEINKNLSKFERAVVSEYLKGYNYKDIAKTLGKDTKSIDNALRRIREKLYFLKDRI